MRGRASLCCAAHAPCPPPRPIPRRAAPALLVPRPQQVGAEQTDYCAGRASCMAPKGKVKARRPLRVVPWRAAQRWWPWPRTFSEAGTGARCGEERKDGSEARESGLSRWLGTPWEVASAESCRKSPRGFPPLSSRFLSSDCGSRLTLGLLGERRDASKFGFCPSASGSGTPAQGHPSQLSANVSP